jgi:hypothetical protein
MLGIDRCEVISAALKAMLVMPGVPASFQNGGDSELGDAAIRLDTAWHAEQMVRAILAPRPTSPSWARSGEIMRDAVAASMAMEGSQVFMEFHLTDPIVLRNICTKQ